MSPSSLAFPSSQAVPTKIKMVKNLHSSLIIVTFGCGHSGEYHPIKYCSKYRYKQRHSYY